MLPEERSSTAFASKPTLIKHGEHAEENWELLFAVMTQNCHTSNSLSHIQTSWRVIPTDQLPSTREYESKTIKGTFLEFTQWVEGDNIINTESSFLSLPAFETGLVAVYADYKYFHEWFGHTSPSDESSAQVIIDRQALWLLPAERTLVPSLTRPAPCPPTVTATAAATASQTSAMPTKLMDWALHSSGGGDCSGGGVGVIPPSFGPEASTFWLGSRGAHTPLHYGTEVSFSVLFCSVVLFSVLCSLCCQE